MDIDTLKKEHRCFGCGKIGHFRNECPDGGKEKKVSIRAIIAELSEEERKELLEGLTTTTDEVQDPPIGDEDFQ